MIIEENSVLGTTFCFLPFTTGWELLGINTKFPTVSSYPPFKTNPWKTLRIMLDNCNLKRSLESIEVTVTLTHLETTFSMLDLGRSGMTDVSSLAVNAYLGLV